MQATSRKEDIFYALEWLSPSLLKNEPDLMDLKWPDYRSLTPSKANLKFAQCYQESFREKYTDTNVNGIDLRQFGLDDPSNRHGLPANSRCKRREVGAIHKARQRADRCGLPYKSFIGFCNAFLMKRGYTRLPRPNQLLGSKFKLEFERTLAIFAVATIERLRDEQLGVKPAATTRAICGCVGTPGSYNSKSAFCLVCPEFSVCGTLCGLIVSKFSEPDAVGSIRQSWSAKGKLANRKRVSQHRARKKSLLSATETNMITPGALAVGEDYISPDEWGLIEKSLDGF